MPKLFAWLRTANRGTLLIVLLFLLLLPIANPRVYATDEVQYYVYLRSLRFDHDLSFANDYAEFAKRNPASGIEDSLLQPNRIREKTGLYGNIAPIGCAIMWAPFFLAADAFVQIANLFHANIPADGFSRPYILSVCYASALYGLLGLLLCMRLARHYASSRSVTIATLGIWLASPLIFYMFVQMPFAHSTGFFLTSLFLVVWSESRAHRSWRTWAMLGVLGALMTMTREQLGLFLLIPAVEAGLAYLQAITKRNWSQFRGLFANHLIAGILLLITISPQFLVYQILNGEPRPASEVSGRINWCSPHFIDTLIDYDPAPSSWCHTVGDFTADFPPLSRGAFVWSPLWAIGLLGLVLLWKRDHGLTIAMVGVFLAQTYINGAYGTTWHLRGAFGFRRLIECTPLFILGLALLLDWVAKRVPWWLALIPIALFIGWNTGLLINATFFENETNFRKIGLIWPNTWRWQAEVPFKIAGRLREILFERCKFLQNGKC